MLQLRARGFALRDAFPDVLKGLVTAEEAQDYPTTPATPEPVVVRPKFDEPAPAAQDPEERANPFEVAQASIEAATTIQRLDQLRAAVGKRAKEGTFTSFETDSLVDQIHAKVEFLEAESEVTA